MRGFSWKTILRVSQKRSRNGRWYSDDEQTLCLESLLWRLVRPAYSLAGRGRLRRDKSSQMEHEQRTHTANLSLEMIRFFPRLERKLGFFSACPDAFAPEVVGSPRLTPSGRIEPSHLPSDLRPRRPVSKTQQP